MGGASGDKPKALLWCRMLARWPKLMFGITLGVHLAFIVITVVLWQTGYNIFPMVFDDLPLEIDTESMYLRNEAWAHRNEELDPKLISRRKRSAEVTSNGIFLKLNLQDDLQQQHLKFQHLLTKPFTSTPNDGHDFFREDDDDSYMNGFLDNTNICCDRDGHGLPLSRQNCGCDPNKINHDMTHLVSRYRRDVDEGPHEREYLLTNIMFIYEDKSGNIFSRENLQKIAKFEYSFYNMDDFKSKYCRLFKVSNVLQCRPFFSILRYFDGSYQYVHDDLYDPSFTNIQKVIFRAHTHKDTNGTLKYFLGKDAEINATSGILKSKITRTSISFGYPLSQFGNNTKNKRTQRHHWNNWAYTNLIPKLMHHFRIGVGNMNFWFMSYSLYWQEALRQVLIDWLYLIGSFGFIFFFMWFQTGSLFVTTFGLCSIMTSFVGANLIYTCIVDYKFFGIFNVLAVFILLGIGADDIFIFADTWALHKKGQYDSLEERLSAVFKRAALAMFVTSLTTMVAFFANSFSPLLAVSGFGSFAGITIFVNYISVITFFPAVVTVHHIYFENKICCCCGDKSITTNGDPEKSPPTAHDSMQVDAHSETQFKQTCCQINERVVRFFKGTFFRFVTNRISSVVILSIFIALVGCSIYAATRIELENSEFKIFDDSSVHEIARAKDTFAFKSNTEEPYLDVTVVWGLKEQDRSGCHKLQYDNLNPCKGQTVWDTRFDMNDPASQTALVNFCRKLRSLSGPVKEKLRIIRKKDSTANKILCFADEMADFFKNEGSEAQYPPGTSLDLPITAEKAKLIVKYNSQVYHSDAVDNIIHPFEIALDFWLTHRYSNESVPDDRGDNKAYLGRRRVNKYNLGYDDDKPIRQKKLMYAAIKIGTDIPTRRTGLVDGLPLSDEWEKFINEEMKTFPEPVRNGFQFSYLWVWLRILQNLSLQSIITCMVGLALAFVVIFLGTQNIITGLVATFLLASVTICVIAIIPLAGWKFGLLEALNLCLIVGLAVDYIVHLVEGYHMSPFTKRLDRIRDALEHVGISVVSGAITTLGGSFFMMFAKILFFRQFGSFIFCTIGLSMLFSLFVFVTFYSLFGPEGYTGSFLKLCKKRQKYKQSEEGRETATQSETDGIDNSAFDDSTSKL